MIKFPAPKIAKINDIDMSYHEMGTGFPVVFSHGWPELAYSWRYQIPALATAGFRAIAPDQRGFGNTSIPENVADYNIRQLCSDLIALLDELGLEKAVFCGHDWGGYVVWMLPLLYPDRVAGIISLNSPFTPRSRTEPLDLLRKKWGDKFYVVQFQQQGLAEELFAKKAEPMFRMMYRKQNYSSRPSSMPEGQGLDLLEAVRLATEARDKETIIPEDELAYYIETFSRTGFTGGINWYRNITRNWKITADIPQKIMLPALMISAANDSVLPPSMTDGMEQWVSNVEKHVIDNCGHWTQQEQPEEVNRLILSWLKQNNF